MTDSSQGSLVQATSGTPATVTLPLQTRDAIYRLTATVALWYAQGIGNAAPTAAAHTNGSCYLVAGASVLLSGLGGTKVSVVQDAAAGYAVFNLVAR